MPPKPLPLDRKDFFKERKLERSESRVSGARWRDSSHHGPREFNRLGSCYFRRRHGHGKQSDSLPLSEEPGPGNRLSSDMILEDVSCSQSVSQRGGKYGRSIRENRGSFIERDMGGHSLNNDPSNPDSGFLNTWNEVHSKDQHDKINGLDGLGTDQKSGTEKFLSSKNWKPLKWTRSGSFSSWGFSHLSGSKSNSALDSDERKSELLLRKENPIQSSVDTAPPPKETNSRKKPRLKWGEGLAKYEKKIVEGSDVCLKEDDPFFLSRTNAEPSHPLSLSVGKKNPLFGGFSDCVSTATPSSIACSSSPGMEDKSTSKAVSVDNNFSNLCGSPGPGSQNQIEGLLYNLQELDISLVVELGTSLTELLQAGDTSLVGPGVVISTAMNNLLTCKSKVSRALEMTESETDLLENELKSIKSENGGGCPNPLASSCLQMQYNANNKKEQDADRDEDIDNPGIKASKCVKSLTNALSLHDGVEYVSGDLNAIKSAEIEKFFKSVSDERKDHGFGCSDGSDGSVKTQSETGGPIFGDLHLHTDGEDKLCELILTSNKESASKAIEVFNKLLLRDELRSNVLGLSNVTCTKNHQLIKQKHARRKQFLKFKDRVITFKFKVFQHFWKENMHFLSTQKCGPKVQKKFESRLRQMYGWHQNILCSTRSHYSSPAGYTSLVPNTEIINYASKLLSSSQGKIYRNNLKMPALILDKKEKMASMFLSGNGLVEDPCAFEKERDMINPWTLEERELFMDKLALFGKDFRKIASFLNHKTTADCIEFYYKNHKFSWFKTKKQRGFGKQVKSSNNNYLTLEKKKNYELNVASLNMLGGSIESKTLWSDDGISEGASSLSILANEMETVAADVLAGICNSMSLETMSSCSRSSIGETYRGKKWQKGDSVIDWPLTPDVSQIIDEETCSDESCGEMDPSDWTDSEKSMFLKAVECYGKDFAMISRCVKTRSRNQCKVFFSKAQKCLGLNSVHLSGNLGSPVSGDDATGGGVDVGHACVLEIDSAILGDTLCSKMDEDASRSVVEVNHEETVNVEINLQTNLSRSEENSALSQLDFKDADDVGISYSDASQKDRSHPAIDGDFHFVNPESVRGQKNAVDSTNFVTRRDGVTGESIVVADSASIRESMYTIPSNSDDVGESKIAVKVSSKVLENEVEGGEKKHKEDMGARSDLQCSFHDSSANASHMAAAGLSTELPHQVSTLVVDSLEKPCISRENSLAVVKTVPQEFVSTKSHQMQSRLLSTPDSQESPDKEGHTFTKRDDYAGGTLINPLLNHVESSQILSSYPLQILTKKDMNGDDHINLSEVQNLAKFGRDNDNQYVAKGCYLQKCSNSKPPSLVTELPLLSQKIEQTHDYPKSQSRNVSDSDKLSKTGDVKLFGQILNHSSTLQNSNCSPINKEENMQLHKLSGKSSNLRLNDHHNVNVDDGSSGILKFSRNNYFCLENVPSRSFGIREGNRIQAGFSVLPDSALLLAKYPDAFRNYSMTSSNMNFQPAQPIADINDRNFFGVSVFSTSEVRSSSDKVFDFQLHRSVDGDKVPPVTVDVKQQQFIFAEMQRRKSFEATSSLGNTVGLHDAGGRGGIDVVVPPCIGISDPVEAIKKHYARAADHYGSSIIREDESWKGEGDNR